MDSLRVRGTTRAESDPKRMCRIPRNLLITFMAGEIKGQNAECRKDKKQSRGTSHCVVDPEPG